MSLRRSPRKRLQGTGRSLLRAACFLFLGVGLFTLGYAGYVFADAHFYQAVESRKLEFASRRAEPRTTEPRPRINGDVIGEIQATRLGLKAIVVQGDSPTILRRAVGHLPGTALPGEAGNVVLAGHRDTFFRPLRGILPGDGITLKTLEGDFQYSVESIAVVPPTDVQILQASGGRTLTLITCFPFYYVGSAPDRFIVRARQIETWPEQFRER